MININQPNKDLAKFYEAWSSKSVFQIDYDIESAERKAKVIINLLPKHYLNSFTRILDFGCGYGALLLKIKKILNSNNLFAIGLDYSEMAIDIANKRNGISTLRYESLHHFEIKENIPFINEMIEGKVDVIMLIDVLEHVPDCKELISELSPMTNYFLIKLPLESSIFDNYIIPKEYPGAAHSNGHLREFNVNNVHYFIRKLGLIPIFETTYIYNN